MHVDTRLLINLACLPAVEYIGYGKEEKIRRTAENRLHSRIEMRKGKEIGEEEASGNRLSKSLCILSRSPTHSLHAQNVNAIRQGPEYFSNRSLFFFSFFSFVLTGGGLHTVRPYSTFYFSQSRLLACSPVTSSINRMTIYAHFPFS